MNNPYLLKALSLAPSALERIVHAVPPELWDARTEDNRFSLREAIAHLADWEPIFRSRIESALQNPGKSIPVFDESQRAIELRYSESDPREQLDRFHKERMTTLRVIELASDLAAACVHPENGEMTVAEIAHCLLGHDLYHIEHLTHYLSLKQAS